MSVALVGASSIAFRGLRVGGQLPSMDAMPSLIQQRLAIDRIRVRAMWIISVSGILLVMGGALVFTGSFSLFSAVSLVIWVGGVVSGIVELQRFRRALSAFEAEHGPGAGRQD